jgi:hypothetical protein
MSDTPDANVGSITSLSTAASLTDLELDDASVPKYGLENFQQWPTCLLTTVDSYLVIMKTEGVNATARQNHLKLVQKLCAAKNDTRIGIQVKPADLAEVYSAAYMGLFPKDVVDQIVAAKDVVLRVVPNTTRTKASVTVPDWSHAKVELTPDEYVKQLTNGNADMNNRKWKLPNSGTSWPKSQGKGANIFIIDVHGFSDFDFKKDPARLKVKPAVGKPSGHGTFMTKIAAGDELGVAPLADIYPFCASSTGNSVPDLHIVMSINKAIVAHKASNTGVNKHPGILSCSWNIVPGDMPRMTADDVVREAIQKALGAGIIVNLAAGNDTYNWDKETVAYHTGMQGLNLVGSHDMRGRPSSFTNFGNGVNVFAPGDELLVYKGSNLREKGTSLATAFLSGYMACMLTEAADGKGLGLKNNMEPLRAQALLRQYCITTDRYKIKENTMAPSLPTLLAIGPRPIFGALVIWPMCELTAPAQAGGSWTSSQIELWSIRVSPKASVKNAQPIGPVTTQQLTKFAENLAVGTKTDATKVAGVRDFWEKSLNLTWSESNLTSHHGRLYLGPFVLNLQKTGAGKSGFAKTNWVEISAFLLGKMADARKSRT